MATVEVWLSGKVLPGGDPDRAAEALARMAKLPPEQARALLAGRARLAKRCNSVESAQALVDRLAAIGVEARFRADRDFAPDPDDEE